MNFKPILFFCLLFSLALPIFGQTKPDSAAAPPQSRLLRFAETGTADADRAVLNIFIREQDNSEPLLGATTLLQRQNPDQVHGKVTQWDGRCRFKVAPATYTFKVQLTGMVTFEKKNIELLAGRQYDMELEMTRLAQPVPSAKSQVGKNRR